MPATKKNKVFNKNKIQGIVDPSVRNLENHPFFIKKAKEAKELLDRAPLPERTDKTKKRS
jgi:hypothetical protein